MLPSAPTPVSRWSGSSRLPMVAMYTTPTTSIVAPTGVKAKNPNGSPPIARSWSDTTRFGGVPINVSMPPSRLPNASGISRRDGAMPAPRASPTTTGSSTATVPVEERKAESSAAISMVATNSRVGPRPAMRASRSPSRSATPVSNRPAPTMNRPAIMSVIGSAKPASACAGVRMPLIAIVSIAISATRSNRNRSLANAATVAASTTNTRAASLMKPRLRPASYPA